WRATSAPSTSWPGWRDWPVTAGTARKVPPMRTRAAQLVELGRMECVESEVEPLREGDLLVRSRYASVCGSDLHIAYDGIETAPELWVPGYPGHEGVGEVLESRSPGFTPGDLVLCVP